MTLCIGALGAVLSQPKGGCPVDSRPV